MISLKTIFQKLSLEEEGVKDLTIRSLNTLKNATSDELSFIEAKKHLPALKTTQAGAVFVTKDLKEEVPAHTIAIVVENPHLALADVSSLFAPKLVAIHGRDPHIAPSATVMPNTFIGKNSIIGENTIIMPGVYIGNKVVIGDNCILHPNVVIYNNSILDNSITVHSGSIIGSDGFGYVQDEEFNHHKIYHTGNIHIESNVEIGANCAFDRAVFGTTIIKQGTIIDNLVHIAHNCTIGEKCAIAGQSGFAGSTIVGNKVMFGAQAGVAGHLKIGDNAIIAARGGVTKSIEGGKVYAGFPLYERGKWLKIQGKIARLLK